MAYPSIRRIAVLRLLARAGATVAFLLLAAGPAGAQGTEEFLPDG